MSAISHGVPLVGTPVALESMGLKPEVHVMLGESADELADAVITLARDSARWEAMSAAAFEQIKTEFGYEAINRKFATLVKQWTRVHQLPGS